MKGDEFYEAIELTEEEIKAAILEGKKRKFFKERSKEYWQSLEKEKAPKKELSICSAGGTRTHDLRVMSPASYQLLHVANTKI